MITLGLPLNLCSNVNSMAGNAAQLKQFRRIWHQVQAGICYSHSEEEFDGERRFMEIVEKSQATAGFGDGA